MDHDSDSYSYFEITEDGGRMLDGEEREAVRKKFWELAKKEHEARKRRIEETMRKAGEEYESSKGK